MSSSSSGPMSCSLQKLFKRHRHAAVAGVVELEVRSGDAVIGRQHACA